MQVWQTVFYECKLQPQPRRFASPWNSKIYQHSIQIIQLKIAGDKSWFGDDHTARASNFGRNQYPKLLCPKLSFRTTSHEQNTFTSAKGVILLEIRRMHNAYISEDWAKRYFSKWHILGIHMMVQRCFPPHPPENSHLLNSKMKVRKMLVLNFSFQPFVFFLGGGCKISGMQVYPTPPTTTSDIHGLDVTLTLRGIVRPGKLLKLDFWWTKSGQANEMEHMPWDSLFTVLKSGFVYLPILVQDIFSSNILE